MIFDYLFSNNTYICKHVIPVTEAVFKTIVGIIIPAISLADKKSIFSRL